MPKKFEMLWLSGQKSLKPYSLQLKNLVLPAAPESLDESRMEYKASTASTVVDDNYENKSI